MKTKEELKQIKEEYIELNKKIAELSEEELGLVTGGGTIPDPGDPGRGDFSGMWWNF